MEGFERRIWWTVGIVSALLLVVAVVLVVRARQEADRAVAPAAQTSVATRPQGQVDVMALPTGGAAIGEAAVATAPRRGAPMIEVCGLGPVRLSSAASEEENDHQLDEAVASAPVPWAAMQASGDERIRAAGLALGLRIEPLVKLAAGTRDATVYAMAQSACARLADDPGADADSALANKAWCETLGHAQRAALEPDNMVSWLQVAADADARRDTAGVDEALRRAAAASTVVHHTMAAVEQVDRHAQATAASASASSLWVHRALGDAGLHSALMPGAVCGDAAPASRREHCAQIADRLLNKPHAIGDLALGLALGRQVGTDEAVLARHRREMEAVQAADEARTERWSGRDRYACAVLLQQREWLRRSVGQGEWRAARDAAVAKAGGSMDALLNAQREAADAGEEARR